MALKKITFSPVAKLLLRVTPQMLDFNVYLYAVCTDIYVSSYTCTPSMCQSAFWQINKKTPNKKLYGKKSFAKL